MNIRSSFGSVKNTIHTLLFLPFAAVAVQPSAADNAPLGQIGGQIAQLVVAPKPADEAVTGLGDFQSGIIKPVILKEIIVIGNQRITTGRILDSLELDSGAIVDSSIINASLQRLYRTGLFRDFSADITPEGVLTVSVSENPIINRIAFEGNATMKDEVLETTVTSKVRRAYSVSKIDDDVRKIQTAYRQSGRFSAMVKPMIIKRPQNRVDVVFEITEGDKTLVQSIDFIGNSFASDRELRNEMFTKTNDLISLVFGGDTYDPDKLAFDAESIRNYYLRHGYADFRLLSTSSELDAQQKGFVITIAMEEGKPYDFGSVVFETSIPELDAGNFKDSLPFETEDRFNNSLIETALVNIENAAQAAGVPFVRVIPQVRKDRETQKIDLTFVIEPGPKRYVETINIKGNVRTLEYVIRRELAIAEGDPMSQEKIELSKSRLQGLQFFKTVNITQRQGTNANDVVLDVHVEEKSTGSISAGLGLSTSTGAYATFGISEANFLGRGQRVAAKVTAGSKRRDYDFSINEPRFMDRDLNAGFNLFKNNDEGSSNQKYSFSNVGAGVSLAHSLFPNWYHNTGLQVAKSEISGPQADSSLIVQNQVGKITKTTISQGLYYDVRNSASKPTKGYRVGGDVALTGLVGSYKMLQAGLSGQWYMPITDTVGLNINGFAGRIFPISGTDVRISDNYFAGGETDIRGFESNGIGARVQATNEALGGQAKAKGSVNLKMPSGLPKHVGLNLIAFTDFGFVRDHGLRNTANIVINDTGSVRISAGVGVSFDSQVPISIFYARPIKKEQWDKTESLVLRLGTSF